MARIITKIRTFSVTFKRFSKLTAYGNELNFEQSSNILIFEILCLAFASFSNLSRSGTNRAWA